MRTRYPNGNLRPMSAQDRARREAKKRAKQAWQQIPMAEPQKNRKPKLDFLYILAVIFLVAMTLGYLFLESIARHLRVW